MLNRVLSGKKDLPYRDSSEKRNILKVCKKPGGRICPE